MLATANASATLVLLFTSDLLKGLRHELMPFPQYVLSFHLSPPRSSLTNKKKVFVRCQVFHVETLPGTPSTTLPNVLHKVSPC